MSIFEKASRVKLRFNTQQGPVSVENLWTASISSLINLEEQLTEVVESYGKTTRRKTIKNEEQKANELRLEIVTHIIDTLEAEKKAKDELLDIKKHNAEIDELVLEVQKVERKKLSVEELLKLKK